MPKLRHFDNLATGRFVTFSTYRRHQLLKQEAVAELFIAHLDKIRRKYSLKLWGYVIMPDHVHLVVLPNGLGDLATCGADLGGPSACRGVLSLGRIIGELKSITARAILSHLRKQRRFDSGRLTRNNDDTKTVSFWQRRCYDHNCRTHEIVVEKINYCHNNPVVRGLVNDPGKWRWSSFGWYAGERSVPMSVDELTG